MHVAGDDWESIIEDPLLLYASPRHNYDAALADHVRGFDSGG